MREENVIKKKKKQTRKANYTRNVLISVGKGELKRFENEIMNSIPCLEFIDFAHIHFPLPLTP